MTKVQAIEALMNDYNGVATLQLLYAEIERYYPNAKRSKEWQAGLRGVLYRDLGKTFKKIDEATYALLDFNILNLLPENERTGVTEKEVMVKVRTLQYKFRNDLIKELKSCPITGVRDKRLLVASHIKPWCLSNDAEKLDIHNGFVLTPLYDTLFDRGLITFTKGKKLFLSPSLTSETIGLLNLESKVYDELPVNGREKYLEFHNDKVFIH